MQTVYKVLNPNTGGYDSYNSEEEAMNAAKDIAWAFYLTHTHNNPISTVTILGSGEEVWS